MNKRKDVELIFKIKKAIEENNKSSYDKNKVRIIFKPFKINCNKSKELDDLK